MRAQPRPHERYTHCVSRAGRGITQDFTGLALGSPQTGEVAERLNAPVSKTGMGGSVHRGFESLPLRLRQWPSDDRIYGQALVRRSTALTTPWLPKESSARAAEAAIAFVA